MLSLILDVELVVQVNELEGGDNLIFSNSIIAREIARFSGASIHGLNNNDYQITRATKLTSQEGVKKVFFQKGDFMNIPYSDNYFDHAYAIEATCHAPDRVGCYAEILRVTKPGGCFAGYE